MLACMMVEMWTNGDVTILRLSEGLWVRHVGDECVVATCEDEHLRYLLVDIGFVRLEDVGEQ